MNNTNKFFVWRDPDDCYGEFLTKHRPKLCLSGRCFSASLLENIYDLIGNPLRLARGEIVQVELKIVKRVRKARKP